MPKFKYAAVDATGATVEGVAKGETIGAVRQILKQKDLVPIRIVEHRGRLDLEVTTEKLSKKELMHFSRQLAVFVRSGIPIIDSLDTIAEEAQDRVLRKVITSMTDQLRQGSTFSSAAKSHPEAFPAYYLGVLESAELTGNLDDTLDKLASYIDRDLQSRSRITAALMYPSVVVVMSMEPWRFSPASLCCRSSGGSLRRTERRPSGDEGAARLRQPLHRSVVHPGDRVPPDRRQRCVLDVGPWQADA
ncbi:MAG: type II secretion system F family protein [Ilumatobacteraceae bacterium]